MRSRFVLAAVALAGCGKHRNEPPASPPPPPPRASDAAIDGASADAAVDLDKIFDDGMSAVTRLEDIDSATLTRAFREYGNCWNASVIGDVLIRRGALEADWGPQPGATPEQLSHDLCVSANDNDRDRRLARLRRYVAAKVTFVDSKCHDHKSERRDRTTTTIDSTTADIERLDGCPSSPYAVQAPCRGATCELTAPGATRVVVTWTAGKLTQVECERGGMMTCTDH